jgi:hypothetical protein
VPGAVPRVRWGLWDPLWAFLIGLAAALVVGVFVVDPDDPDRPATLIALLFAQNLAVIAWLALTARRKGTGSMRDDFGLELRRPARAWLADVPYLFFGVGLQIVAVLPIYWLERIYGHEAEQSVVEVADNASTWEVPLLAIGIVLLAPLAEELLFRGVLLRALCRKYSPTLAVFVSALVFGLVHAAGDPSVGTLIALPALVLVGLVCGYQAVRTGTLSRSILIHMGFNALSAVVLFTT